MRILIWKKIENNDGNDIFHMQNYPNLYKTIQHYYANGFSCPNWGNKLWIQGLYSGIDQPYNQIVIRTDESIEQINSEFDCIIFPMANCFSEGFIDATSVWAEEIKDIRVPIYVIACGAQASSYDALDDLLKKIGDKSKRYIDAIYKTGGEFALRGHFTKEFFTLLGYKTPVVTGCPSLYSMGPDLEVRVDKKTSGDFPICALNGHFTEVSDVMRRKERTVFMDQDEFLDALYDPHFSKKNRAIDSIKFIARYGSCVSEFFTQDRIKLIVDLAEWYTYLKNNVYYSFGSRIHGNIIAILAGTPATVWAKDSRTREMAEFYDIPCIVGGGEKGVFRLSE